MIHRIHLQFVGRVQRVGFRYTCQNISQNYPVTGWVKNIDDGSVSLLAEGELPKLMAFVQDIEETVNKSTLARIDSINEKIEIIEEREFDSFSIAHF